MSQFWIVKNVARLSIIIEQQLAVFLLELKLQKSSFFPKWILTLTVRYRDKFFE